MEIFLNAPAGEGKTKMAELIILEYALKIAKKEKPLRITRTTDFGPDLHEMVEGSHVILFDEIPTTNILNYCRRAYKKTDRKALAIYVIQERIEIKIKWKQYY